MVRGLEHPDQSYSRTSLVKMLPIGVGCRRLNELFPVRKKLDGRSWRCGSEWPLLGQDRAPCPVGATPKNARRVALARVQILAAPAIPGVQGLEQPLHRATPMTIERPMFPPRAVSQDSFAALAAGLNPRWHKAVLRLAKSTETVSKRMDALLGPGGPADLVPRCRSLAKALIDLLDEIDPDPDFEPSFGYMVGPAGRDECDPPEDTEPSLGSFDRMIDQEKSWRARDGYGWPVGTDNELDNSDHEDSEPLLSECSHRELA